MQLKKNKTRGCRIGAGTILMLVFADYVHAGGSLLVDDAGIMSVKHCQLDSWARVFSTGQELTAAPACNIAGTELGISVSEFFNPRIGPLINVGAKHALGNFDQKRYGVGASISATWSAETHRVELWNVNIPTSVALDSNRNWILHANIGWLDTRDSSYGLTGGLGVERAVTERAVLLAELYVQHDDVRIGQFGLRSTVNDYANIDVFMGHMSNVPNGPWFGTIGLNLLFP